MRSVYHKGELAVQTQAGVREMAERVGRSIRASFPSAAIDSCMSNQLRSSEALTQSGAHVLHGIIRVNNPDSSHHHEEAGS